MPRRSYTQLPNPNLDVVDYSKINGLINAAYNSPMAQGQRLRMSQPMVPGISSQAILSPDAQSQTEIGYTQPIQDFTGGPTIAGTYFTQPGGTPSGSKLNQPNLKQATPNTPIPTGMPWNY